jgi:hypothetical protein
VRTRGGVDVSVREVIATHPHPTSIDREALVRCIDDCADCVGTCTACADACLAEEDVRDMVRCIRRCLDCADLCGTTGRMVTRQTEPDLGVMRATVEACAAACRASGDECERHAHHHKHCRICAETCRRCERSCNEPLAAMQ